MIHNRIVSHFTTILVFLLLTESHAAEQGRRVVLLADDFESTPVGEPIRAAAGRWTGNAGFPLGASVVADGPSSPSPPSSSEAENKQWARLDRAANGRTEGRFDAGDLAVRGGKLHVSFWMYVVRNQVAPTSSSSVVAVGVGSTLTGRVFLNAGVGDDNRVLSNHGDEAHVDRSVVVVVEFAEFGRSVPAVLKRAEERPRHVVYS